MLPFIWALPYSPLGPGRPPESLEEALEQEMAYNFSVLAWKIPWAEEPGGLQSRGPQSWTLLSD